MSPSGATTALNRLKAGYSKLLDVATDALERPGFVFRATAVRDRAEWANWILPLWLFKLEQAVVCSVSPRYAARARAAFGDNTPTSLLAPATLALARSAVPPPATGELEWVQTELLYYPGSVPPPRPNEHQVEQLRTGAPGSARLLRTFDGGVFVVRAPDGGLAAHAAIKNKGVLRELAVGTDEPYRRMGMGKAVVSRAVAHIVAAGQVATYYPDTLSNSASFALAYSAGFKKVAEMCFCCYAEPGWAGFEVPIHE